MRLHDYPDEFQNLISLVAAEKHLPESAIARDYDITILLKHLENSEFADRCVFKGGTSLSKCYPESIERFSEDIVLTFLGMELTDKACDKAIKKIESIITVGAQTEKIPGERSNRSKSLLVWYRSRNEKIKLEIGSNVRPDPYSKKSFRSYIHEFLECHGGEEDIRKYGLEPVTLSVLHIERTFVDKLMSVKRHAICGTLANKVRHIYDVTRLFALPEIQAFLSDSQALSELLQKTKSTDSFYLQKRGIHESYNPLGAYDFASWKHHFDADIQRTYENLHHTLLYTDKAQNFNDAISAFTSIDRILQRIGE